MRASACLGGVALALVAGEARAHIRLIDPAPRHEQQKSGPCGAGAGDLRGDEVTVLRPGATITVRWQETVPHPGYFRISFDADGQDAFADPPAPGEPDVSGAVLVDGIADREGTEVYTQEVTLPEVECERCTLQLVQVMTDKAPYGDGNDLYYQCADLVLSVDGEVTPPVEGGEVDAAAGCGCRGGSGGPLALLVLLATRRRRSQARS